MSKPNAVSDENRHPVRVFVRIRPMVKTELELKHDPLEYKSACGKKKHSLKLCNLPDKGKLASKGYGGFERVMEPGTGNEEMFAQSFGQSCLPHVLAGDKVCSFAYGHTGSGKTHTMFGSEQQGVPGMFSLFARALFGDARVRDDPDVLVEVRFSELYDDRVWDLLNEGEKRECFLREDESGRVHVRTTPTKEEGGRVVSYPVSSRHVGSEEELSAVVRGAVASRRVGNSSLHDQSSRSHAFLEFEIVSKELLAVRAQIVDTEADLLLNRLLQDSSTVAALVEQFGSREKVPKLKLLYAELAEHAVASGAQRGFAYKGIKKCEKQLKELLQRERKLCRDKERPHVGGTMVFVDLAGNEYGRDVKNLDKQEERERNNINASLLALKECIRALHAQKKHVCYRNSKLTMYLRKYLRGKDCKAVMVANIGSSREYAKQTINTLRYSAMVAHAGK